MDAQELTAILKDQGMEVYEYSGRYMYGAQCPAVTIEREVTVLGVVAGIIADFAYGSDNLDDMGKALYSLVETFNSAKIDNVGLDIVLYFPNVRY
jgi:hypothetical protein